ncbi:hypothetical protein ACFPME_04805 [Rhodanobacter umsongensis]|uniref:Uncharacterized protein n=1 Tax=Rhodanobacter umsongensis TaxID=633153 RepID=A0ABW0JIS1_9GAMM
MKSFWMLLMLTVMQPIASFPAAASKLSPQQHTLMANVFLSEVHEYLVGGRGYDYYRPLLALSVRDIDLARAYKADAAAADVHYRNKVAIVAGKLMAIEKQPSSSCAVAKFRGVQASLCGSQMALVQEKSDAVLLACAVHAGAKDGLVWLSDCDDPDITLGRLAKDRADQVEANPMFEPNSKWIALVNLLPAFLPAKTSCMDKISTACMDDLGMAVANWNVSASSKDPAAQRAMSMFGH